MTSKAWLIAGALALAGCATTATTADKPAERHASPLQFEPTLGRQFRANRKAIGECTGVKCRIDLAIKMKDGKCQPRPLDPADELVLIRPDAGKPRYPVLIVWTMTTPGYLFKEGDGIQFRNGAGQFDKGGAINAGREWQWIDKMTEEKVYYKYNIRVTAPDGSKCDYDPGLINDWSTDP